MDLLAKNLFDDFDKEAEEMQFEEMCSPPRRSLDSPRKNKGRKSRRMRNGATTRRDMMADLNSSPKSSDSCIDELGSMDEFMSPTSSPIKPMFSPEAPKFTCTPPCLNKGILNLRLFDTPHTPKTLFTKSKKASIEENEPPMINSPISYRSRTSLREKFMRKEMAERKRPQTDPRNVHRDVVYANFNPFTPNSEVHLKAKRARINLSRYIRTNLFATRPPNSPGDFQFAPSTKK